MRPTRTWIFTRRVTADVGAHFVGEFEDVCEAFSTSIELAPEDYVGDAILLDPSGSTRTTAVDLGFIQIFGNDELVVPIDFPSDSFF